MSAPAAGGASFSSGECSMISGTTRSMNLSSSSMRLFFCGFSNTLSMNDAVASLPASSRANATIFVRRSAGRRATRRTRAFTAGSALFDGEAGILDVTHAHARRDVRRRRAIDDHLRSAVVDVVVRGDDRNPRGLEPDLHVFRRRRRQRAEIEERLARRRDDDARRAGFELRHGLLAERERRPEHLRFRRHRLIHRRRRGRDGNRDDLPVLLDGHRDVLELRSRPFDRDLQRPGLADDAIRFVDGDRGGRFAARDVEDRGDGDQEEKDESSQPLHEEN